MIVLVHGLWHGSWSWDLVRAALTSRGVDSLAVDLPMTAFEDDVAVVTDALSHAPAPVVLAGHSYGGAVITGAASAGTVSRLVYIAAFQLDAGESIARVLPGQPFPDTRLGSALRFSADGAQVDLDPVAAPEILYGQAPPGLAEAVVPRLRPAARSLFAARASAVAWREVGSTYVVCAADRCVAPELQRAMARRAARRVERPSDHTPLLSHPDRVADLLAEEEAAARSAR
jgi:pimeloyl-ACP methyl ester carboxylesterase